jgi:hypothetical protein
MSPTPALARQLVARMDSVLADLGQPSGAMPPMAAVELRQIAGLTAGGSLPLLPGRHEFGPAGDPGTRLEPGAVRAVAFHLDVDAGGGVVIEPGSLPVRVDGRRLSAAEPLDGGVVDVGTAAFTLHPTRSPSQRRADRAGAEPPDPADVRVRVPHRPAPKGPLSHLALRQHRRVLEQVAEELDRALARAAGLVAAAGRAAHPDPEELLHRARHGDRLWTCPPHHARFGLAPVALGELPWRPPLEAEGPLEPPLERVVAARSMLPLVPLLADLRAGPVVVVGPRAAGHAVLRHLVVSLLVASRPADLRFSLLADPSPEWAWLEAAPRAAQVSDAGLEVVLVDAGLDTARVACERTAGAAGRMTAVALVDTVDDVPEGASAMLWLDGRGTATWTAVRSGWQVDAAIPIGLPVATAAAAVRALAGHHRARPGPEDPERRP